MDDIDDFDFDWADRRDTLAGLPDDYAQFYEPADGGGYTVLPYLAEGFRQTREGIAAHDKKIAELDAETTALKARTQKQDAHWRMSVVTEAIRAALEREGCKKNLIPSAVALLMKELDVTVEEIEGDEVEISANGGGIDVEVRRWLASPDAESFVAPKPLPGSGKFSEQLASLKRGMFVH